MVDKSTFTAGSTLPELHEDVDEAIAFMTRVESPLLLALGFPGNLKNVQNPRHEWLEEALNPDSTTVNGNQTAGDGTIEVAAGTSSRFLVGDVLQVDGSRELMVVTAIPDADTLTVTRAIRGTTGAAISDGAVIRRLSNPATECEDAPEAQVSNRVRQANYTEIFRRVASVCRSMQLSSQIGLDSEMEHQIVMSERELIRDLAKTIINGKAQTVNPEGTTTTARTMDGIIQRILTGSDPVVVDAGGATLDEILLNDALREMFVRGASPTLLAAPPTQKRAISTLIEGRQRFEPDSNLLGAIVQRFMSDFAMLDILEADTFIPPDAVLILDPSRIRPVKLGTDSAPWEMIDLSRQGLANKVELVGEFGLEMKNAGDGGHALIQNLAF